MVVRSPMWTSTELELPNGQVRTWDLPTGAKHSFNFTNSANMVKPSPTRLTVLLRRLASCTAGPRVSARAGLLAGWLGRVPAPAAAGVSHHRQDYGDR